MILVNPQNLIFEEVVQAIDNYKVYLKLTTNREIKNPFVVTTDNPVPIINYTNVNAIKAEKSPIIIIDMITEGLHVSQHFYKYPKNKKYIFFSSGRWDITKFNFGFEYDILYWHYFIYDYVKRGISSNLLDFFQEKEYSATEPKDFTFSTLIGTRRDFRDKLVNIIQQNIKFDNFVLNYAGVELGKSSRALDINYDFDNYNSYKPIHQYYSISSSLPTKLYNKSKVLLVVETTCGTKSETTCEMHDEFFVTEKTVKALLTGIPFVLCGSYNFLKNLKALGFRTYNEIWDESYDQILNVDERMLTLVNTLNDIDRLLWDETVIDKCKQIAYHNKSLLLNVNSIMKTEIEAIIEKFENY